MRSSPSSPNSWSGRTVPRRLSGPLVPTIESPSAIPLSAPVATTAPAITVASLFTKRLTRGGRGGCGSGHGRLVAASERRRRECRCPDHEYERDEAERELELVARKRLSEDHRAGRDGAQVRRGARHGDDRNGLAHLEAPRRNREPDQRREQDHQRKRVDPPERALVEVVAQRLDRDVG